VLGVAEEEEEVWSVALDTGDDSVRDTGAATIPSRVRVSGGVCRCACTSDGESCTSEGVGVAVAEGVGVGARLSVGVGVGICEGG